MVPDKFRAMKEAYRVLKPGGELFLIGLRSDADYDMILTKFAGPFDAIDLQKTYEQPIRSQFSATVQKFRQNFDYYFHNKKLAIDAFSFAITHWHATSLTESKVAELDEFLENYKDGSRIRISFPAEVYKASK